MASTKSNMLPVFITLALLGLVFGGLYFGSNTSIFKSDPMAQEATEDLVAIAQGGRSTRQLDAIKELGNRPQDAEETFDTLATLAVNIESKVSSTAEAALKKLGDDVTPFLKPLFEANGVEEIKLACASVKAIGPPAKIYLDDIEKLLKSEEPIPRRCGLFAMQGLSNESRISVLESVISCLSDIDFQNQCMACRVIEPLGAKAIKAAPALENLLENGNPSTRSWAALCLGQIGDLPSNDKAIDLIDQQLAGVGENSPMSPIERERYIKALTAFGPKAEAVLKKY